MKKAYDGIRKSTPLSLPAAHRKTLQNLATGQGKGGVLGPIKVARSGLQHLCTSPRAQAFPAPLTS